MTGILPTLAPRNPACVPKSPLALRCSLRITKNTRVYLIGLYRSSNLENDLHTCTSTIIPSAAGLACEVLNVDAVAHGGPINACLSPPAPRTVEDHN